MTQYVDIVLGQTLAGPSGRFGGPVRQIYTSADRAALAAQYPLATPAQLDELTAAQDIPANEKPVTALDKFKNQGKDSAFSMGRTVNSGNELQESAQRNIKFARLKTIGVDDKGQPFVSGGSSKIGLYGQPIYFKPDSSFFSDFLHNGLPIALATVGGMYAAGAFAGAAAPVDAGSGGITLAGDATAAGNAAPGIVLSSGASYAPGVTITPAAFDSALAAQSGSADFFASLKGLYQDLSTVNSGVHAVSALSALANGPQKASTATANPLNIGSDLNALLSSLFGVPAHTAAATVASPGSDTLPPATPAAAGTSILPILLLLAFFGMLALKRK